MDKFETTQNFIKYRKSVYASINCTKGNLMKLCKSNLLSKREKELLNKVIDDMEVLRIEYYNNRGKKEQNILDNEEN